MVRMQLPRHVSFSSGGCKGLAFAGVLDALEDHIQTYCDTTFDEWRASLLGVAGCSAGSIAALMLALGLDRTTRHQVLMQDLSDMRSIVRCPNVSLLFDRFGIEDGSALKQVIQDVLMSGGMSGRSTLGDLKRLLRIDVIMVASNLNRGEPEFLSAATHPDMPVCDAVFASCCVPFLFAPQVWEDAYLVDGYLTCSLPQIFDEADTLFVKVPLDPVRKPANWAEVIHRFFACGNFGQQLGQLELRDRAEWFLEIALMSNASNLDHTLSKAQVERYVFNGYVTMLDRLTGSRLLPAIHTVVLFYIQLVAACEPINARASVPSLEIESESEGDPDS